MGLGWGFAQNVILPSEFFYAHTHLLLVIRQITQSNEYQDHKQPRKIYAYTGMSEKWGLSYTNQEKSGQSCTLLKKKKEANHIYLAALKKGTIRHAHPYYAIYRKLPPPHPTPPPQRAVSISNT